MAAVHEIKNEECGIIHGTDGVTTVSLLDPGGRMFKRRAIKGIGSASPQPECWLVCELNGVRVYQQGTNVIVTTQDINP